MKTISYKRHRFPPEIICHAVWFYARFTLSLRDVEDLLAERGLDVSHETVRRWLLKFGSQITFNLRRTRPTPSDYCHLDEMVIVMGKGRYWLWRAVDKGGEVLDFLVQSKRNAKAALKMRRTPINPFLRPAPFPRQTKLKTGSNRRVQWRGIRECSPVITAIHRLFVRTSC